MTFSELQLIIPLLRRNGVSSFKHGRTEVYFESKNAEPKLGLEAWLPDESIQKKTEVPSTSGSGPTGIKSELVDDVVVPTNLEEEPGMTAEQILFWGVDPEVKVRGTGTHDQDVMKREVKLPEAPAEPKAPPQGEGEGNV